MQRWNGGDTASEEPNRMNLQVKAAAMEADVPGCDAGVAELNGGDTASEEPSRMDRQVKATAMEAPTMLELQS